MAKIKTHNEDCLSVLGETFEHVHKWLDEYAKKYSPMIYLERHRQYRHHAKGIAEVKEQWGFYAERAAKLHIIRDNEQFLGYVMVSAIREDQIDELYEKALRFCHDPVESGIYKI